MPAREDFVMALLADSLVFFFEGLSMFGNVLGSN